MSGAEWILGTIVRDKATKEMGPGHVGFEDIERTLKFYSEWLADVIGFWAEDWDDLDSDFWGED